MRRPIFGTVLPSADESFVGDIFVDTSKNEIYVFDDGKWQLFPQEESKDGELPEVTTSDNGKVLKVIRGEWAKGTIDIPQPEPAPISITGIYENENNEFELGSTPGMIESGMRYGIAYFARFEWTDSNTGATGVSMLQIKKVDYHEDMSGMIYVLVLEPCYELTGNNNDVIFSTRNLDDYPILEVSP